ncbi:MAG: MBL fold metallo-hydrolase [Crocinitomicaceae bacterium]
MRVQRLNMDNSWRIEFAGKSILIDPWLKGTEVDYFSWFNTQWHKTNPMKPAEVPEFDLVIITQKYPDHYHQETLLDLQPSNLIVPTSIEKSVRKLLPEAQVKTFGTSPLQISDSTLKLHFIPTKRKIDPIYDALVLENGKESILMTTHGYDDNPKWKSYLEKMPPIKLAMTPFNLYKLPFFLGGTVAPGLQAVRRLIEDHNPQKVTATHDEDKHAKGLVTKFARVTLSPKSSELLKDELFKDRLLTISDYKIYSI